jgi:hypothetical protein
MEYMKTLNRILVRKAEGKRLLGKLKRRWAYNIRTDLME